MSIVPALNHSYSAICHYLHTVISFSTFFCRPLTLGFIFVIFPFSKINCSCFYAKLFCGLSVILIICLTSCFHFPIAFSPLPSTLYVFSFTVFPVNPTLIFFLPHSIASFRLILLIFHFDTFFWHAQNHCRDP